MLISSHSCKYGIALFRLEAERLETQGEAELLGCDRVTEFMPLRISASYNYRTVGSLCSLIIGLDWIRLVY